MMKTGIKFWPFNVVNPPYSPENQKVVKLMARYLDLPQTALAKRFALFILVVWLLWLVVTKRLTVAKLQKWKKMAGMAITMARQM